MRAPSSRHFVGAAIASLLIATGLLAAPASAKTGPAQTSFLSALSYSTANGPDVDPPGANDWSCQPTPAHPRPVVLLHGTFGNRYRNWAYLAPQIRAAGYCVFSVDYGAPAASTMKGTGDVVASATEVAGAVDRVLEATGAEQVDFVGHSQGGMLPRAYLQFLPGRAAGKVRRIVGIAPSSHGTTFLGIATFLRQWRLLGVAEPVFGTAFAQQLVGSAFNVQLAVGGDTRPGIDYTVIATQHDEIVTPYSSQFLTPGPGATVRSIVLQRGCPVDGSDHFNLVFGRRTRALVLNALDPAHPRRVPCDVRLPLL